MEVVSVVVLFKELVHVSLASPVSPDENTTGCAYGYVNKNGSSNVQTGVLRGRGGGEKVASCARCASLCSSTSACMSYQCSPTTLECSLYSAYSPTGVAQADFAFCFKNGQSCSFGYHSIYGNVLGNGRIGAHGGNENVPCGVCADYCSSQSTCLSYSCNHATQLCNLNTIGVANAPTATDVVLCRKDGPNL